MLAATTTPSRSMLRAPTLRALLRRPAASVASGTSPSSSVFPASFAGTGRGGSRFRFRCAAASEGGGRSVTTVDVDAKKPPGRGQQMIDLQPVKGTRDFPPDEMRTRTWLFQHFRDVAASFGFEEWDAPVLEPEALFTRKAGEEITTQLYNFADKAERRVALRPELTPSFARLILQQGKALATPAKWFAIGQCWRYERMTRGRRREHYQWNMDIVGVSGVEAEAELLSAITTFFKKVGVTEKDVGIKVSSRKVLQAVLNKFHVPPENFANVCVVVDKIEKLQRETIVDELAGLGLTRDAIEGILGAMEIRDIDTLEKLLGPDSDAVADLKTLFEQAKAYGYYDWLVFDASVVRGLAYYTGIVFEGFDRNGELRAICGGGRYDKLLGALGGAEQPMVGFGFGDAVIMELLNDKGLVPETLKVGNVDDLVFPMSASLRNQAIEIAQKLRNSGRSVDLVLENDKKAKWVFKRAERIGAKRVVLLGEKEWENGLVRVKDLETREETDVTPEQLC
jgi:histidyl-tRNA synthetase|tara:strand:- start:5932 stop:7461 length:1530 start_codon:yes stop_codon:yes gene_type:complete